MNINQPNLFLSPSICEGHVVIRGPRKSEQNYSNTYYCKKLFKKWRLSNEQSVVKLISWTKKTFLVKITRILTCPWRMQCRRAKNSNLQIVEHKIWTSGCRRIPTVFSNTPNLLALSPILNKSDNRIIERIFIYQQNWMEINLDNNKLGTKMNES